MVYLSRASISSSRGISPFQRSRLRVVSPCRDSAAFTVATTPSTSRSRLRCRRFCGVDSFQGIFLRGSCIV